MLGLYFVFTTLKWNAILRIQGVNIKFIDALRIYLIGNFYGFITPGTIGSLIRAKYIKDLTNSDSVVKCSTSIVIERILDFMVIIFLSLHGALLIAKEFTNIPMKLIVILALLFIILDMLILKKPNKKIREILYNLTPSKFKLKLKEIFNNFYETMPKRRKLIYPLILTIITWILLYTELFILSRGLGMQVPYLNFITFTSIATVISLIPVTISGLGTREATWIILFKQYHVLPEQIIAMTLINLFIGSVIPSIIGFGLSIKK